MSSLADESEDERIKREIWEEVNRTREERLAKEKIEREQREAKLAARRNRPESASKPKKPVLVDDSEASEKLLEQRRKIQEERSKFAELRKARAAQTEPEVEIAVANPTRSASIHVAEPTKPAATATPFTPTAPKPTTATTATTARTPSVTASATTSDIPVRETKPAPTATVDTNSSNAEAQKWKTAYENLLKKFDSEQAGKRKVEEVLAQYETTINSLMSEQESGDSAVVDTLRQQNSELQAQIDSTTAEIEVVSASNKRLTTQCKELRAQLETSLNSEKLLQGKIQLLQSQSSPSTQGDISSESLNKYRAATSKQIEVLKLRCAKAEAIASSLQTQLNGKTQENEKLTSISDTLISMLESVGLSESE